MSAVYSDRYFSELVESCLETSQQKAFPCLVFNTDFADAVCLQIHELAKNTQYQKAHAFQFLPNPETDTYWPFSQLIRELSESESQDLHKLVNEKTTYPSKIGIIQNVLQQSPLDNPFEEPLIEEVDYEKSRINQSFLTILKTILAEEACLLILKDIHFAPRSVFQLLAQLSKDTNDTKLRVIGTINKTYHFPVLARNHELEQNLKDLEEHLYIYESGKLPVLPPKELSFVLPRDLSSLNEETFQDLLEKQLQLSSFFELRELVNQVQESPSILSFESTPNLRFQLTKFQALAGYYMGEIDGPLQNLRNLLSQAERAKNPLWIAESYARIALLQLRNNNVSEAQRMAQQSIKFAERSRQGNILAYATLVQFMICDVQATTLDSAQLDQLVGFCRDHGYLRTLIFIHKDALFYTDYYKTYVAILEVIDGAIHIAKKLQNEHALAMLYHKKGIVFSIQGKFDQTIKFFELSEEIRTRLGDPLEIIRICNGIGYYYILLEAYPEALEFFQKAANSLYKVKNFSEICLTLLNLSLVFLLNKDYNSALNLINKILQLMQVLHIQFLPFRSIGDIFIIKAYCLLRCDDIYKAVDFIGRAHQNGLPLTNESKVFEAMVEASLLLEDSQSEKAITEYQKAIALINRNLKSQEILLPFLFSECAEMLLSKRMGKEAQPFIQAGIKKSQELNYPLHRRWLRNLSGPSEDMPMLAMEAPHIPIQTLEELAKKEVTVNLLNNKINNIEFLQRLQQLFTRNFTEKGISLEFLDLILVYFAAEAGFVYQKTSESWRLVADMKNSKTLPPSEDLLELWLQEKSQLVIQKSHREKENEENPAYSFGCSSLITIPMKKQEDYQYLLVLATVKEDVIFSDGDLDILSIAANQVQFLYDRIAYEETLKKMANTDSLTSLASRKHLQTKLSEEISRLIRYGNLYQNSLSLMFIDLDNFKYYNDQFGHSVGDLCLVEFAELLKSHLRNIDFISRFGGDEFILVMPETNAQGARIVGERILAGMQEAKGFQQQIHAVLKQKEVIPEEKLLTCSMGVVSMSYFQIEQNGKCYETEDLVKMLMKSADEGLYRSKEQGKNRLTEVEPNFQCL